MPQTTQKSQLDRSKEAARQLECDDNEATFNEKLKRVTKAKPLAEPGKK